MAGRWRALKPSNTFLQWGFDDMLLCRFLLEKKEVVALWHEGDWIPVAQLLPDPSVASDMISLLGQWPQVKSAVMERLNQKNCQPLDKNAVPALPFQPASIRDFMLSETHAVNAARGMVKRFMPGIAPLTKVFEKITGRVFPAFKPKPIWYRQPIYYMTNHLNLICENDEVPWPAYTKALDYELELAFVVTRPLFNATPEQAREAVGGFMILNDFSARDVQLEEMRSGFGPQKAKHFLNALSSTVATADDILDRANRLPGKVFINDELVCETDTSDMQHTIADMLVHVSRGERLHPGEVFGLGTMPGGCAMENGRWLRPGDSITLTIEGVGQLRNRISEPTPA